MCGPGLEKILRGQGNPVIDCMHLSANRGLCHSHSGGGGGVKCSGVNGYTMDL